MELRRVPGILDRYLRLRRLGGQESVQRASLFCEVGVSLFIIQYRTSSKMVSSTLEKEVDS